MDESREEREELDAIQRDDEDDAREQEREVDWSRVPGAWWQATNGIP